MKYFLKEKFRNFYNILSHIKYFFKFQKLLLKLKELQYLVDNAESENDKVVIFNMVRTYIFIQLFIEIIFALKLKQRGYKVVVLYDDGIMLHHETLTKNDLNPYRRYYILREKVTIYLLQKIPSIGELLVSYSTFDIEVLDSEVQELINKQFIYNNIDLFEYIEASLVRFFLSAPDKKLLEKEEDYDKALLFFTKNALLSYKVAEASIDSYNPNLMITSHGIYSTWGVFMKKYLQKNIKVVSYGGNGYVVDAIDFGINDVAANKIDNGFFNDWVKSLDRKTTNKFINLADNTMKNRFSGKSADTGRIKNYVGNSQNQNIEKIKLLKRESKQVFAIFPNVMWDNATTFKEWNTIFSSPIEWLIETVRYFMEQNDKVLVIRVHPAEYLWMEVRVSIKDILQEYFGNIIFQNKNIIFIPPNEKILSYELFPLLNAGIVYNGTIGLELMYQNIPLIMGARTAYSYKNFTKDLKDKSEYFTAFENSNEILKKQQDGKLLLKLFIYEYFYIHGVPLKILSKINLLEPNFEGKIEKIWKDENLTFILDVIEDKRKYFQEWDTVNENFNN